MLAQDRLDLVSFVVGCVSQTVLDIFCGEVWKVGQYFGRRLDRGEIVHNVIYCHAHATDACFAAAIAWLDSDLVFVVHA